MTGDAKIEAARLRERARKLRTAAQYSDDPRMHRADLAEAAEMDRRAEELEREAIRERVKPHDTRETLMGLVHKAAVQLGLDEDIRRAMQQTITGKPSCRDMTENQLKQVAWHLKRLGADIGIPGQPLRGGNRWDRPTRPQLTEIERLALRFGWEQGLDDPSLLAFIQRTAKVDAVRFLTKRQASDVITGLRRWANQGRAIV